MNDPGTTARHETGVSQIKCEVVGLKKKIHQTPRYCRQHLLKRGGWLIDYYG